MKKAIPVTMQIGTKYSLKHDGTCFHLMEAYEGTDKNGKRKQQSRTTYHGTVSAVATKIAELEGAASVVLSGTIDDFARKMERALERAIEALHEISNHSGSSLKQPE